MARLGIDYGTTNTVVVCNDRGRYPIVPHKVETAIGEIAREIFPSLAAKDLSTGSFLFGADAERCLALPGAEKNFAVIRSLKRMIRDYTQGSVLGHDMVPEGFDPASVLVGFASTLKESIQRSGLFPDDEPLQVVLTWPANANGAQRYLTRRCFREAGFEIVDTLNEPTAAAVEFADRITAGNRTRSRQVVQSVAVFDLGGGTFDVSLVKIDGTEFHILDSAGIERLGGDDLDQLLVQMFCAKLKIDFNSLRPYQRAFLLMHAQQQKEGLSRGTVRSLTMNPVEFGVSGSIQSVPASRFLAEAEKILASAVDKLADLLTGRSATEAGINPQNLGAIYLVGGSSQLPLIPKMLATRFPKVKLIQSDKPFTATAMGAAIHSGAHARLHDILTRTFGVYRLAEHGTRDCFCPVFTAGTRLPRCDAPPLEYTIEYAPHHNIGYLRYLECATVNSEGRPAEGIREWSEAFFPYDPRLDRDGPLNATRIESRHDLTEQRIRETYSCDADGVITASITRCSDGFSRTYEVFKE